MCGDEVGGGVPGLPWVLREVCLASVGGGTGRSGVSPGFIMHSAAGKGYFEDTKIIVATNESQCPRLGKCWGGLVLVFETGSTIFSLG